MSGHIFEVELIFMVPNCIFFSLRFNKKYTYIYISSEFSKKTAHLQHLTFSEKKTSSENPKKYFVKKRKPFSKITEIFFQFGSGKNFGSKLY